MKSVGKEYFDSEANKTRSKSKKKETIHIKTESKQSTSKSWRFYRKYSKFEHGQKYDFTQKQQKSKLESSKKLSLEGEKVYPTREFRRTWVNDKSEFRVFRPNLQNFKSELRFLDKKHDQLKQERKEHRNLVIHELSEQREFRQG